MNRVNGWWSIAAIFVAIAVAPSPNDEPIGTFEAAHWDSISNEAGFQEVFVVTQVNGAFQTSTIAIQLEGQPIEVSWNHDGSLMEGDLFSFSLEPFDFERRLTGTVRGVQVMELPFGSGAGTPVA